MKITTTVLALFFLTGIPLIAECELIYAPLVPGSCDWDPDGQTLTCGDGWNVSCSGGGGGGPGHPAGVGTLICGPGPGGLGIPNGTIPLSSTLQSMLDNWAKPEALEKVQQDSCAFLWSSYGLSPGPAQTINLTTYVDDTNGIGCTPGPHNGGIGPNAWVQTHGSMVVNLCQRLVMSYAESPWTIIHEALHSAGLPESPQVPGALASSQIGVAGASV